MNVSIEKEKMVLRPFMADFYFNFHTKNTKKSEMPFSENHLMSRDDYIVISVIVLHCFASVN